MNRLYDSIPQGSFKDPAFQKTLIVSFVSLIPDKVSRLVEINSLIRTLGNSQKSLGDRWGFRKVELAKCLEIDEFPVFSLFIREMRPETGSRQTAPSANQSVLFAYNLQIAIKARVDGRFDGRMRTGEGFPGPIFRNSRAIVSVGRRSGSLSRSGHSGNRRSY
jgi:hypothetical protein